MRKSTHKKILTIGCIATIISLAGIKTLPVKATGPNEQKTSLNSDMTSEKMMWKKELFAPGNKIETCGGLFWYKCIISNNGNQKIYYKSKKPILKNINDLLRKLKDDEDFFSTEITNKKEIEKIDELFDFETESSVEETFLEELSEKSDIKTPEEFEKLSKIEKAEYLISPGSELVAKMSCNPLGSNIFKYNTLQFHKLLNSRLENYFEKLFSKDYVDTENPENKKLYNEYLEYVCNLCKAIEKFMESSELCEMYQRIYNILKYN